MVVPIGNIANKFNFPSTFSSTITFNSQQSSLPTVSLTNSTEMDKSSGTSPKNNVEVRGRSSSIEINLSRNTSMSSTRSFVTYHKRMANNSMEIDTDPLTDSPALSYKMEQEKFHQFRKAADTLNNMRLQNGNNKASPIQLEQGEHNFLIKPKPCATAPSDDDNIVINIQLPYDPNSPTEPELWSGNFHLISLYGSIKHITSDTKSIKDSLNFMAKYISNKKVNPKNANDLKDFDSIGDSIWNFISAVYQASWDSLLTDNKSKSLREKIVSKFSPRIALTNAQINNKDLPKSVPISLNKVPPPPPLPPKFAKEVNAISKYFQNKKPSTKNKKNEGSNLTKSYAQASKSLASTTDILKIKEAFPTLNAKKIKQVNNIVKGNLKPKPKIQMITKDLSRKQVIIPMSKDNIDAFMKNSFLHVANINRQLRNAKSEIFIDYIHVDPLDITIVTSKVCQQSDLLIINQHIKNSNEVNTLQVEEL